MADDVQICRLCLCSKDNRGNPCELLEIDDPNLLPNCETPLFSKFCSRCYEELQEALEFRQRVQFMQSLWENFRIEVSGSQAEAVKIDFPKFTPYPVNCHVCGCCMKFNDLKQHIQFTHGSSHVSECRFCQSIMNEFLYEPLKLVDVEINDELEMTTEIVYESVAETNCEEISSDPVEDFPPSIDEDESHHFPDDNDDDEDEPVEIPESPPKSRPRPTTNKRSQKTKSSPRFSKRRKEQQDEPEDHVEPSITVSMDLEDNPFSCHLCDKSYSRKFKLKTHLLEKHNVNHVPECPSSDRIYTCDYCSRTYKSLQNYDKHIVTHDANPFVCFICTESFPMRKSLKLHENLCLNLTMVSRSLYQCVCCSRAEYFNSPQALKSHMSNCVGVEDGKESLICSLCNSSFKMAHHLLLHKERRHGQPVQCQKCSKTFPNRAFLKKHFDRIHIHSQSSLQCKECGQKLSRPDKLMEHMRLHTGFPCRVCGLILGSRAEHLKHLRDHKEN